jgi:hypothetical protein
MELIAGIRLRSAVCPTEIIVLKAPPGDVDLRCGGVIVVETDTALQAAAAPQEGFSEGTQLGKRYAHSESGLELLCTKTGEGSLSVGKVLLTTKQAKTLPASD